MGNYDITFIGHMPYDEVVPYKGDRVLGHGGSMLLSSSVPARIGKKTAVIVKMADRDKYTLKPMQELGVSTYVVPSSKTTYIKLVYPTADTDKREFIIEENAGAFKPSEMPEIESKFVHLAGIADIEYDTELIRALRKKYKWISIDMQSIVRHVDKITHKISFDDDPRKKEIASLVNGMKMDNLESKILTGTDDTEKAAIIFEKWGCPEVMITDPKGVLLRAHGKTYYEEFTNRSKIGRTGRGDTTFAAYLSWRIDHDYAESIKFAATLVSIKMETPGPFVGTLEDVLTRLSLYRSSESLKEVSIYE